MNWINLDPTSHKAVCCNCGKKTFVNYLGVDGLPIGDGIFGRCDRQDHCGYFRYPYEYLNQLKAKRAMNQTTTTSRSCGRFRLSMSRTPVVEQATPVVEQATSVGEQATPIGEQTSGLRLSSPRRRAASQPALPVGEQTSGLRLSSPRRRAASRPAVSQPCLPLARPLSSAQLDTPPQHFSQYDMERTFGRYSTNPLAKFLHSVFDKLGDPGAVELILQRYCVGTSVDDHVIYWQVDAQGMIRTGKVMAYDPSTGKRLHTPGSTGWMHRQPFRLEQAFFGSHLLTKFNRDLEKHNAFRASLSLAPLVPTIWLFESEKAALIAALYLHWGGVRPFAIIPMATGSCDCFNPTAEALANPYHRLQVLRGQRVVLLPDEGMFDKWHEKALLLPTDFCHALAISPLMESAASPGPKPECEVSPGDGPDDIFLRYVASGRIDQIINLPLY